MLEVAQRKTYTNTMEMTRTAPIKCLQKPKKGSATEVPKDIYFSALISGQKADRTRKILCTEGDTVAGNIQLSENVTGKNVKNRAPAG